VTRRRADPAFPPPRTARRADRPRASPLLRAQQHEHKLTSALLQVNNAGIARGKTILDTKPEEFLLTYKVNVLGAHNILREFLPYSASSVTLCSIRGSR